MSRTVVVNKRNALQHTYSVSVLLPEKLGGN